MSANKSWQVAVSPDDFTSMQMAKEQIRSAMPVSGLVIQDAAPNGSWLFLVLSQIDSQEEMERLLTEAGIPAKVSPLGTAE